MRFYCAMFLIAGTARYVSAQSQADRDWPMFNRDLAGTRYSPLKQIELATSRSSPRPGSIASTGKGRPLPARALASCTGDHAHRRQRHHVPAVGRSCGRAGTRNRQGAVDVRNARQGPRIFSRRLLLAGRS